MSHRYASTRQVAALTLIFAAGCGGPSDTQRDNRKALEFLLTAVTMRNTPELERDAKRIDARRAEGLLSSGTHRELTAIIAKAREGYWEAAEEMTYKLREAQPFPR